MAHIIIQPMTCVSDGSGGLQISGVAFLSPDCFQLGWDAVVQFNDSPATILAAIKAAAIAGAESLEYVVGAADKKTVIGNILDVT